MGTFCSTFANFVEIKNYSQIKYFKNNTKINIYSSRKWDCRFLKVRCLLVSFCMFLRAWNRGVL